MKVSIEERFSEVSDKLKNAGEKYHLPIKPQSKLVAVTKTHGAEAIMPLLQAGHRIFGENRVQEAAGKWPLLKEKYPDIELHLIGPLQTNKVKEALALFDVIETLDREKLARELAKHESARTKKFFIQVNTGEEPQKAGIAPQDTALFAKFCQEEAKLPVIGLMCIPPVADNPAPHFALLKNLAEKCGFSELSMGMSHDFELAAAMGATYVRVGSAIFGERN